MNEEIFFIHFYSTAPSDGDSHDGSYIFGEGAYRPAMAECFSAISDKRSKRRSKI